MGPLDLYVPRLEELGFYQRMLADPETMSYNANWDVRYAGYHRDTGCIDFPEAQWAAWHAAWVGREPARFFAYIERRADGEWLGHLNFHYDPDRDWWDMGIVLAAAHRGRGYAAPALRLMLDHAFCDCGVTRVHNDFELARNEAAAWAAHRRAGFRELCVTDGFLHLLVTREDYLARAGGAGMQDAGGTEGKLR